MDCMARMISVERIDTFRKTIEKEGSFENEPAQKPPKDWPLFGQIKFQNVSLYYLESDGPVLKNVDITISPGMKVKELIQVLKVTKDIWKIFLLKVVLQI